MKNGFVKSSPRFFRLIGRSFWLLVVVLLALAASALVCLPLVPVSDCNRAKLREALISVGVNL